MIKMVMGLAVGVTMLGIISSCIMEAKSSSELTSPDGVNKLSFKLIDGVPHYRVSHGERPVVNWSRLGFTLQSDINLATELTMGDIQFDRIDETWEQPWGEEREIRNNYNEMRVKLVNSDSRVCNYYAVFRAFNDGIGFQLDL